MSGMAAGMSGMAAGMSRRFAIVWFRKKRLRSTGCSHRREKEAKMGMGTALMIKLNTETFHLS
jgi:hypothetical protein